MQRVAFIWARTKGKSWIGNNWQQNWRQLSLIYTRCSIAEHIWHKLFTKIQSITFRAKSPKSTALATTTASVPTASTHPYTATAPLQFPHQNEHGVTYSPKYAQPLATVWWIQTTLQWIKLASSDKPSTKHSTSISGTSCVMKSKASNNHWCCLLARHIPRRRQHHLRKRTQPHKVT